MEAIHFWIVAVVLAVAILMVFTGCAAIPEITAAQFGQATSTGTVVVMFSKDFCPPCDVQESELAKLKAEFPSARFVMYKAYDILIQPVDAGIVKRFKLEWTPTTVIMYDGHEVARWTTYHSIDNIRPVLQAIVDGRVICTPEGCHIIPPGGP